MSIASDLLERHIETLLSPGEWEALIADGIVWELPFAPALGHPGRLEGREAVEKHVNWFRDAVEDFRFSESVWKFTGGWSGVAGCLPWRRGSWLGRRRCGPRNLAPGVAIGSSSRRFVRPPSDGAELRSLSGHRIG